MFVFVIFMTANLRNSIGFYTISNQSAFLKRYFYQKDELRDYFRLKNNRQFKNLNYC